MEENNFKKWEFDQTKVDDEIGMNTVTEGIILKGGISNPSDISFAGHQRQIEDMMHSIETGCCPLIGGLEGRKSVEIVLAIYEIARSARMVRLTTSK